MVLVADVCMCEYTDHGHCGPLERDARGHVAVANDRTLPLLARAAVAYAKAGADIVAPSDMMDGRVAAIRKGLDENGLHDTAVLSYAVLPHFATSMRMPAVTVRFVRGRHSSCAYALVYHASSG